MTDLYTKAGVNIAAGNRTIELMKKAVQSTYGTEVLAGIGAFGGMYHAKALQKMSDPVLVASTDGIGTKVHIAAELQRYRSLGHDIVNHSVNDILVQGARPLFFLDYVAASKLVPETMAEIVTGMSEACRAAGCALLGGETAEMPGVYAPNQFDVAGTIVGVVERASALPKNNLAAGDVLLGIASSGPHTNGYSLIRKVFEKIALNTKFNELSRMLPFPSFPPEQGTLGDALLAPHRSYLPVLQPALQHAEQPIKGLVHITGGGFFENIPRVLSENIGAEINSKSWQVPPLFHLIQQHGNIPRDQMYHVFNMGIGMIMITDQKHVELIKTLINEPVWQIGELKAGEKKVTLL
jgi:phosphoribosylformylglycinamidine cyclo-ligase